MQSDAVRHAIPHAVPVGGPACCMCNSGKGNDECEIGGMRASRGTWDTPEVFTRINFI